MNRADSDDWCASISILLIAATPFLRSPLYYC